MVRRNVVFALALTFATACSSASLSHSASKDPAPPRGSKRHSKSGSSLNKETKNKIIKKQKPAKLAAFPKHILRLIKKRNYKKLAARMEEQTSPLNGRRPFLLGYASLKLNRSQDAVSYFRRALRRAPELRAHILHFSARASLAAKDDEAAKKALEKLILADPASTHVPDSLETLARIEHRGGKYLRAAARLGELLRHEPNHENAGKFLARRAKAFERAGRMREAAVSWRRLWLRYPESAASKRALDRAGEAGQALDPPLRPFGPRDYFLRARHLQKKYHFEKALGAYRELTRLFPASPYRREVTLYESLALYSLRRTEKAQRALKEAVHLFPADSPARAQVRFFLTRNQLRRRDQPAFESEASRLLEEAPNGTWAARTRFLIARVSEDDSDYEKAARFYREVIQKHPLSPRASKARWQLSWILLREKDYFNAARGFEKFEAMHPNHRLASSALFWGAAAALRAGEREKAEALYLKCAQVYRHRYYGQRAIAALRRIARESGFAPKPIPRPAAGYRNWLRPPKNPFTRGSLNRWRAGEMLDSMGLHFMAAEEFKRLGPSPYFKLRTARAYLNGRRYDMAIKIMHKSFWDAVRSGGKDLPPSFWKIAFPLQENNKRPGDADTLLVNAIIRAESFFDRNAFSRAGAIGLMQLMPATARRLSRKLKIPRPSDKALFDPALNVRLGARYLGDLVKEFKGELVPAIASYNAGKNAVKKWWDKRGDEPVEVFIERIPYQETRNYVKKVLGYLNEYRRIYGKRRQAPAKAKR